MTKGGIPAVDSAALKLEFSNIFFDRKCPRPADLEALLTQLQQPRPADEEISPNAKEVARRQRAAVEQSESDAIDALHRHLLLLTAKDGGCDYIDTSLNQHLLRAYLPDLANPVWGALEQARPDSSTGYILHRQAQLMGLPAPFTVEEDRVLRQIAVAPAMHFPFLTCQWKSGRDPAIPEAQIQGRRDGALIVNYLRSVYKAVGIDATTARTCHFSAICDFRTVYTYVHWANVEADGRVCYEMDRVGVGCFLEDAESLRPFRRLLRNLQDHAVAERLADLKAIVPSLTTEVVQALKVPVEVTVEASSSGSGGIRYTASVSASTSSVSALREREGGLAAWTPESAVDMGKKRPRTESSSEQ